VLFGEQTFYNDRLDTTQAFALVLLRLRQEKGLTHEVLAERSSLHPTTISLLERGKRQPSLGTIFMLAGGLDVEPERLIRDVRKLRPKIPA
jgi:transcriptional regulator with XRE-family HTH domain